MLADGTPSVSFAYDRLGRQKVAQTFLSAHHFAYDPSTLALTTETIIANGATNTITRDQDVFGRASAVTLGPDYAITYAYDNVGRFSGLSSSIGSTGSTMSNHWQYTYLPNSDLISGWSNGILQTVRTYEPNRDLITAVENRAGTDLISRFDYTNDQLARRTARIDHSGAGVPPAITNTFGYNPRSELTSAAMGTNQFGYAYDPIGNRQTATHNAEALTYLANDLNQYTTITNGGIRTLAYDLDGNLTNDSVFAYTWDGENRLISAEQVGTAVPAVRFAYDYMSRRVEKAVNGVTNRFVYDGWNLVSETTSTGVTNDYVWGLDLSGSLQGAGGIGGLLAVIRNGYPYHPASDANGNITDYVDTNGTIVAHYEFDAFGNTVVQSGTLADAFAYRFSTKYLDDESGLYYYGYRYYSPGLGRWVNRDPIGENGSQVLRTPIKQPSKKSHRDIYMFNNNNAIIHIDALGLLKVTGNCVCYGAKAVEDYFNNPAVRTATFVPIVGAIREPFGTAAKDQFDKMTFICKSNEEDPECVGRLGYSQTGVFRDINFTYGVVYPGRGSGSVTINETKNWKTIAILCADQLKAKAGLSKWLLTAIHETVHNIGWGGNYIDDTDNSFDNKLPTRDSEHRRLDWGIPSGND